ncbi:hypothetical protein O6H91_02G055500 [Diphasiastrum complanatum]|uniref:Uncharacterized protein n=1 Tax=Diphasiastrum complanatum TaxID=34168 RepID=A0ACC2EG25_DIPCM|nr:hypothetical protein O6H91_02G055500 [Diphasiastrum complanatum]
MTSEGDSHSLRLYSPMKASTSGTHFDKGLNEPYMDRASNGSALLWASCAAGQLIGARALYRRGDGGAAMPLRAFLISTLLVGAGACSVVGVLDFSGLSEVHDFARLGRSIRKFLGKQPRVDP